MKLTVLGSGTLLPDDDHRSASHLLRGDGIQLLLDCGSGTVHGMDRYRVDWRALTHLFISHFHTDHFGDLPALLWALKHGVTAGRVEPLTLLGPKGLAARLDGLSRVFGEYVADPGFPLQIVELRPGQRWQASPQAFQLSVHEARHTSEALAVRVDWDGGGLGYTGDTGPLPALESFFSGVDLLVAECAVADSSGVETHLSPTSVAELARGADPSCLLLTHLYPEVDRKGLEDHIRALGFTGSVFVPRDGTTVEWVPHRGPVLVEESSTGPSN
jgi:ribonuclease BN (tRNA processing enzyme)